MLDLKEAMFFTFNLNRVLNLFINLILQSNIIFEKKSQNAQIIENIVRIYKILRKIFITLLINAYWSA